MSVGINMVLLRRRNFIEVVPVDVSHSLTLVLTGQVSTLMSHVKTLHHRICENSSDAVDKCNCYNGSVTDLFLEN
jgi:hypothetical protein